ncbi:DMT family transporter [uncultured Croceicoccus sp.]|uniref:DMT family transporter n=1 Tax=uncultured Croceicoccus sp. TaxID=1295329 RepID=UPI00260533EE|nr:DMT family transporter [uncultured Croceicoccus sp.]
MTGAAPRPGRAVQRSFSEPIVWVPFVLVTFIWGSTWLVIKDQISVVPVGWTVAYRFIVATIGMFILAGVRGDGFRLGPGGWGMALLIGITQFVVNFQFVYRAELYLTSGIVAVLFALILIPNSAMSWLFLKRRQTARFVVGSVIALSGVALLFAHEYRIAGAGAGLGGGVTIGIVLALTATMGASIANVAQDTDTAHAQPFIPLLAWSMLIGAAINVGLALVIYGAPAWDPRWEYGAGILYLGVVGSVMTFPLYFGIIRMIGAGKAAYIGVSVPVIAMMLSTLFEGYVWSGLAMGGAALAMAGLIIALRGKRAPPPPAPLPE